MSHDILTHGKMCVPLLEDTSATPLMTHLRIWMLSKLGSEPVLFEQDRSLIF